MTEQDPKDLVNARRLMRVGLVGTKLYLILLLAALPSMAMVGWIKISALELNQVGDFLAGLFGPLAIFWIVLGFFQQGEELKQGTRALLLQAEELKNSVEQQTQIAKSSREQLELDRITRAEERSAEANRDLPLLVIEGPPDVSDFANGMKRISLMLINRGAYLDEAKIDLILGVGNTTPPNVNNISANTAFIVDIDIAGNLSDNSTEFVLQVISYSLKRKVRVQTFEVRRSFAPSFGRCNPEYFGPLASLAEHADISSD